MHMSVRSTAPFSSRVLVYRGVVSGTWLFTLCWVAPSSRAGCLLLFWLTPRFPTALVVPLGDVHRTSATSTRLFSADASFAAGSKDLENQVFDERLASLLTTRVLLQYWARRHRGLQFPLRRLLLFHRECACGCLLRSCPKFQTSRTCC